MEIEKIATSAVITEISKTERLSSFINSGDKEPCWDGNVYIHEGKNHTKKNIKKVATQVKGKLVKPNAIKDTIKYPISYDDLNAYMMNGGTMFFVVYIDNDSGNAIQVYYTTLLPIKVKELFKTVKTKYQIEFKKFPSDNAEKTELFLNFYSNAQKQNSFAGKDLPTIEDLVKQGVLESLSFFYTGIGNNTNHNALPKAMDGKPFTLYANVKGGAAPIPVEYFESIQQITMQCGNDTPVLVNDKTFYDEYQVVTTADKVVLHIGSCVKVILPNKNNVDELFNTEQLTPVPLTIKINIKGKLSEQISGIQFIIAMLENKGFSIGDYTIPVQFGDDELSRIKSKDLPGYLNGLLQAQSLLEKMNVKKDMDIQNFTEEDNKNINLLVAAIGNNLSVKELPDGNGSAQLQCMQISNLKLAIIFIKNDNGGYGIFDYFSTHLQMWWKFNDAEEPVRVSQFSTLKAEDFLSYDNVNLQFVVDDFKMIPPSDMSFDTGNMTLLEIIKAYDKSPSIDLLSIAKQMSDWLRTEATGLSEDVMTLNDLQISLRERPLNFDEKNLLHNIIKSSDEDAIKFGAFLLLDEQAEAQNLYNNFTKEEKEHIESYPIFKFYKNIESGNKK